MMLNQSDDKSSSQHHTNPLHSQFLPHQATQYTHGRGQSEFTNKYRRTQIILSIILVVLTTIWVQITVQRHGPFIRTAQCYFNQIVFLHDSQDIYEGDDVIYWRNGETYDFSEMKGIFQRLNTTLMDLEENSLFEIPRDSGTGETKYDAQMLVMYRFDDPRPYHEFTTYNFSLQEMGTLFQETLLNRSFYQHLWKVQLSIIIPIQYRGDKVLMRLYFECQIYSSLLMQYKLDVDLIDDDLNQIRSEYGQGSLGVRKINNPHNLELSIPYINWIILVIYMVVFLLEYRFIIKKNDYLNMKIKQKIKEESKIQKLLKKIDERERPQNQHEQFNIELQQVAPISSKQDQIIEEDERQELLYEMTIAAKLQKIGYYYIFELILSLVAFFGYYNNHNGVICFFAWSKLLVYLAETKNRLMFGFLFEQTIPTYLRIQFNIILFITAFLMFNMLVLNTTKKFETLELGYYEYFFNYFAYGIYQNWTLAFSPFGMLAQFFYFIQIMLLLYIGNNILISVLANQVSKNSYLSSVEEMIEQLDMKCPNCGTDFQSKKKGKDDNRRKEKLVSKLIKDLQFERIRQSYDSQFESEYNIVIKSPNLSPYFPRKNQKQRNKSDFLSPNLKNKNLKDRLKQINKRMQQEESSTSKIEAFEELRTKVDSKKKIHIELSDQKLQTQGKGKYHKRIRTKVQMLFEKIEKFRSFAQETPRRGPINNKEKQKQVQAEILNMILSRVNQMQQMVSNKIISKKRL